MCKFLIVVFIVLFSSCEAQEINNNISLCLNYKMKNINDSIASTSNK